MNLDMIGVGALTPIIITKFLKVMMETVKNIYFKIRNIFLYSVVNQNIRDQIGIRLVSAITRNQGWFLWTDGAKGVYDLFALPNELDNQANYLIKYYPSTEEEIFHSYPNREKELRTTRNFIEGAPLWDDRENEMADDFVIGQMDLLWEDRELWASLTIRETENDRRPLAGLSKNFFDRFIRALCIFNQTQPSLAIQRTTLQGSEKVHQLMVVLLPNALDKPDHVADICEMMGVKQTTASDESTRDGLWTPLFIEGVNGSKPANSSYIDASWWSLPEQMVNYIPVELHI